MCSIEAGSIIEEALSMLPKDSPVYTMQIEKLPEEKIAELEAKVAHLDKEADWLARFLGATVHCTRLYPKCDMTQTKAEDCAKCWREASRKAIQDA